MADFRHLLSRAALLGVSLIALTACSEGLDIDLRGVAGGLDTTEATRQPTQTRPDADSNGVIRYPNFDVAVARRGDTVQSLAARIGQDAGALARYNGLSLDTKLRRGEVIALPARVGEGPPSAAPGLPPAETIDITTLAGNALNRAQDPPAAVRPPPVQAGPEPIQHQVVRGETAYSIARLYNVSVRSLADWNGLGPDLTVREGQFLLIPIATQEAGTPSPQQEEDDQAVTVPGEGTIAPEPPSASNPLPEPEPDPPAEEVIAPEPLAEERTAATAPKMRMPVQGPIIRDYKKGENDGVDIGASGGAPVGAADAGTVAKILLSVDDDNVLVIRHAGDLLTVYANIQNISVAEGDRVSRGQTVAEVRAGAQSFLHFEVRRGFDSQDPIDFVN